MRLVALAIALLLLAAACGGSDGGSSNVTLTEADSGSTIDADVGEEIVVELAANPTTGYEWQLTDSLDVAVVEKVSQDYAQDSGSEDAVGAGGKDTWTFKAVAAGTTTIQLDYLRTFEENSTTNTFSVTVRVAD